MTRPMPMNNGRRAPRRPANAQPRQYTSPDALPVRITGVTASQGVVTVAFDTAVVVTGIPAWTVADQLPSKAELVGGRLVLTYVAVGSADQLTVPDTQSAVRSASGGRVIGGTFDIAFGMQQAEPSGGDISIAA